MKRAQRTALIITTTAYRTVSHAALCVLSGNMPIHIKAKMRKDIYDKKRNPKRVMGVKYGVDNPNTLMQEINNIINKANEEWQIEWRIIITKIISLKKL